MFKTHFLPQLANNLKKALAFLMLMAAVSACRQKQAEYSEPYVCHPIDANNEIYVPLNITQIGEKLFVTDFQGDNLILEYDLESNFTRRFARAGNGPSEFTGPLDVWGQGQKLFVHDRRRHRVGYFDTQNKHDQSTYAYSELFVISNSVSLLHSINDGGFIAHGYFPEGRYALINQSGEIVSFFGDYPDFKAGENLIPFDAKAMFHQNSFSVNLIRGKAAALSSHVLDIIDFSSETPVVSKRILLTDYDYNYQSGVSVSTELKEGYPVGAYSSITSCNDFIFFVFAPYVKGNPENIQREIHKYDWEGNLLEKRIIPCDIRFILAANGRLEYGVANLPEPKFVYLNTD